MNLDYHFPLFDSMLQGKMNPLLPENNADADFRLRLQEQIIDKANDEGRYTLTYLKWIHPKADYYHRLLLSETFAYCNELRVHLQVEENISIRTYYREMILDRHLATCLYRLGEVIQKSGLKLNSLTQHTPDDTTDSLANCYVLHLLKVCIAKAYLEFQQVLADVVTLPQTETMLYSAYLHELPPVKTFLVKRIDNPLHHPEKTPRADKQVTGNALSQPAVADSGIPEPEYMLVKEAATTLKVNEKTIRRRLESGEIQGVKDKSKWLIDKTAFKSYLNGLKP